MGQSRSETGQTSSNFPLASHAPPSGSLKDQTWGKFSEANPTASDMLARAQSPACAVVMLSNQFLPSSQRSITDVSDYRPVFFDVASDAAFPRSGLGNGAIMVFHTSLMPRVAHTQAEFGLGQWQSKRTTLHRRACRVWQLAVFCFRRWLAKEGR